MNKEYNQQKNRYNFLFKIIGFFALSAILPNLLHAQTTPVDGIKDNSPSVHAFTNATIITEPGRVLNNATLIIRNGVIENVGQNVRPPADARIWDMSGKTLYPGFINAHSDVGMKDPRVELDRGTLSWNAQLRAQLSAADEFEEKENGSEELRSQGFTTALSVPPLGIFRGEAAVLSLGDGSASDRVVRPDVAQSVSMTRSPDFGFTYPTSPIGTIAFIRQTLYDADWYERAHQAYRNNPQGLQRPESNAALAALKYAVQAQQPLLFETSGDEEIIRVFRISEEFNITPWILGNGHEYKILDVLRETRVPLILPLDFPDTPEIDTPEGALDVNHSDLRHWYVAPENPARLDEAGIEFSFSTSGLEEPAQFLNNLRKSVHAGLSTETALAALTTHPASLFGIASTHGTLSNGKAANIIITDGDLFDDNSRILDVWIDGNRYRVNNADEINARGEWQISSADGSLEAIIQLKGSRPGQLEGAITINSNEIELSAVSVSDASRRLRIDFPGEDLEIAGFIRITASISDDSLYGWAEIPGRDRIQIRGTQVSTEVPDRETKEKPARDLVLKNIRPAMNYGYEAIPDQPGHVLVRNATIWTMGPQGILENADLLIANGEVAEVGQNITAPGNALVIDAAGKHVTPGLIDAHLHSGVNGVNEMGSAIVPEVRMGDVLHIDNIWMYRQIAGGLTTAHVMHGSANPIGGQNVHIKMRWGALSDGLKFENAPRTVKFALGENPKRVGTDRYPETRMGVEQIIADRFRMARDYEARWNEWNENGEGLPPRRDIRLDAIVDILNEDILVQSHSYRQDEILMLMRLAEEFDFTIKAFHHGVEAYKVAPELAEHGAGAVVWTDWSSFKIEAYDATLYNARLLHEAGVLTSLHSDNSQLASRMNWEAAKMVRAGMDPEDAMALITINTAKLLGIDESVGSLEPGKDADFVIWNGDPLSTFTKPEQTWIDGRKYFDLDKDAELRTAFEEERTLLIQRILEEKND